MGFLDRGKERAARAAAAAERARQLAAERDAAFLRAQKECPLPVRKDGALPGGVQFLNDEFLVGIGKDWGWSSQRLALTTHRVIHTHGRLNRDADIVFLTDIRDVHTRKNMLTVAGLMGMGTVSIETAGGKSLEGLPMATNSADIRNQILTMVHYARERTAAAAAAAGSPAVSAPPDKYEQLKQLAELRDQGILSQQEFEAEKARLLAA